MSDEQSLKKFENFEFYTDVDYTTGLEARIKSYDEDEPETLKWIEGFPSKSIFYDIGSNIGGFSFYTSMLHKDSKVYSFEPNFVNFYTQQKTILKNNIKNVHAYNIAINDFSCENDFYYTSFEAGYKGTFGKELQNQMRKSQWGNPWKKSQQTGVSTLGISLDTLIYDMKLRPPTHIKVDVDGNDLLVLKGASKFLSNNNPVELFVEIDEKIYPDREIQTYIESLGGFEVVKELDVGEYHKPMIMILYKKGS